jgi:small-conductance mechanosensitive channel
MWLEDPRIQALIDQVSAVALVLERPVVLRQLLAFALIFFVSWLLPVPLGKLLASLVESQAQQDQRLQSRGQPVPVWRSRLLRFARGFQLLLFPLVGIAACALVVRYFAWHGWPNGLLQRLSALFWLVLVYRLVAAALVAAMGDERARGYLSRFVQPIFVILIIVVFSTGLAANFPLFEIPLFTLWDVALTLRTIISAAVVLYLFFAFSWIFQDFLKFVALPRAGAEPGVANTILVISRYAILAIGVLATFSILGFDLSALAIIFGGLSVGIGFGLQELVSNFISGILLLFDQTLRPGDIIEVGGQRGTVTQLRMRATVLRTIDNIEVFVPNKTLLTSTVATYTQTDRVVRRVVPVGVSYNSNPTLVRDLLLSVATSHGVVMRDPPPNVFFTGFGESSLNFELIVWVDDPTRGLQVSSDLHFMIFREFAKHGIEIPFPQRDLHLRSTVPLVPLAPPAGATEPEPDRPSLPDAVPEPLTQAH